MVFTVAFYLLLWVRSELLTKEDTPHPLHNKRSSIDIPVLEHSVCVNRVLHPSTVTFAQQRDFCYPILGIGHNSTHPHRVILLGRLTVTMASRLLPGNVS